MSNLDIIDGWQKGNNMRPVSIGFNKSKDSAFQELKIGDRWEDSWGKIWEKTSYGKKSIPKVLTAMAETCPNCKTCDKKIENDERHDQHAYQNTKNCFDCMIQIDTDRKIAGTFEHYEKVFMYNKELDYIEDMLAQLKHALSAAKDEKNLEFINEFGDRDKWSGIDTEKIAANITQDIKDGKKRKKTLKKALADIEKEIAGIEKV